MPNYSTYNYNYSGNVNTDVFMKIWPYFAAFIGVILLVALFMLVCNWFIFKKAGRPGWAALIPYYNTYVLIQIVGRPMWFFWAILVSSVVVAIPVIGVFLSFLSILTLVLTIIITVDLAKVFGKTGWFAVLMIFLPIVGYPILAFGPAKYLGPKSNSGINPLNPVVPTEQPPANPPITPAETPTSEEPQENQTPETK